jgi:hypothetical protein
MVDRSLKEEQGPGGRPKNLDRFPRVVQEIYATALFQGAKTVFRKVFLSCLALLLLVGGLGAANAIVLTVDQEKGNARVRVGKYVETVDVKGDKCRVLNAAGKKISYKALKKGAKVTVKYKNRRIVEIRLRGLKE